jgi:hypothetical protein
MIGSLIGVSHAHFLAGFIGNDVICSISQWLPSGGRLSSDIQLSDAISS